MALLTTYLKASDSNSGFSISTLEGIYVRRPVLCLDISVSTEQFIDKRKFGQCVLADLRSLISSGSTKAPRGIVSSTKRVHLVWKLVAVKDHSIMMICICEYYIIHYIYIKHYTLISLPMTIIDLCLWICSTCREGELWWASTPPRRGAACGSRDWWSWRWEEWK